MIFLKVKKQRGWQLAEVIGNCRLQPILPLETRNNTNFHQLSLSPTFVDFIPQDISKEEMIDL